MGIQGGFSNVLVSKIVGNTHLAELKLETLYSTGKSTFNLVV